MDLLLLLFLLCLFLFIIQIIMLFKSIKKKEKKYWISLFCLEICSIIMLKSSLYYYDYLVSKEGFMPGFQHLSEELICFCAIILYLAMICISIIAGIIVFEKNQKLKDKKSENPLKLIIAAALIMIGVIFLALEVRDNLGKVETTGTVVDIKEIKTDGGIEYWSIIQFNANGQEHKDDYPLLPDVKIGDTIKIYYSAFEL